MIEKIRKEIEKRMKDGDGFTRIYMKDGRQFDVNLCVDGNYLICYPPYIHIGFRKWCRNLDEVAKFFATV